VHRHLWRRADEHHRLTFNIAALAAELDISYQGFIRHRDRLVAQGKLQLIKRVAAKQAVYRIVCPAGAEDERGIDRTPEQTPRRVLRWG
jgi:hypothetical protein